MAYPDKKQKLIDIFKDTQDFYENDPFLADAVARSRKETRLYGKDEYPDLPVLGTIENLWLVADDPNGSLAAQGAAMEAILAIEKGAPNDPVIHGGEIRMKNARTFEAAMQLRKEFPDKKIAVLNFASATRPGGGVKLGSSAQEEALCRCSTLFPTLDRRFLWQQYYDVNQAAHNALYDDALIYSPGVIICKTDEAFPKRLAKDDFVSVDVISCAAPNLRMEPSNKYNPMAGKPVSISQQQLYEIQLSRARHILHIAAHNKVDVLILGAFGCGAFQNDPDTVAMAWRMAMYEYQARFDLVEFAIPRSDKDSKNYNAFYNRFEVKLSDESDRPDGKTRPIPVPPENTDSVLKVYSSELCPDCRECKANFDAHGIKYQMIDINESLRNLKEFLALRDALPVFDEIKAAGGIGIPALVTEDGTVTLDWEGYLAERNLPIVYKENGPACSLDSKGC